MACRRASYYTCVMLCYVLCYLDYGQEEVTDHEQLNDDLRKISKIWTVQS